MNVTVDEIVSLIEEYAPINTQEPWDNSGLQIGSINDQVKRILIAMDITDECIDYAISKGINLILTHHPFIFSPLSNIDFNSYKGDIVRKAIENKINIFSFHTNLDKSVVGTNNILGEVIGLKDIKNLTDDIDTNIGVYGFFENGTLESLLSILISEVVPSEYIRCYGKVNEYVRKVALIGGSGASEIQSAINKGCEAFITSDVKYHDGQTAYENGITLIDIGHFYSEFPVLSQLENLIKEKYFNLEIEIFLDPVFII